MVGWHHRLSGHESEQAPGDSGQGGLACCSPRSGKESDTTEQLNNEQQPALHVGFSFFLTSIVFRIFWISSE